MQEWPPEPPALVVSDPQAALEAAVQGMGIAQAGLHHGWDELRRGRIQVLLPRLHHSAPRTLALQYPHRSLVAPRVRATVDYLLDAFSRIEALHVSWEQVRSLVA